MTNESESQPESGAGDLLLVGDDDLNGLIGETLEADGHRCDRVRCAREARRQVLERRYDAILLDLDALGGGALEVVQLVARLAPATVCILRSRTMSVDTVLAAMRAGLGDFLGGTLSVPQIRLRLRAAVRRSREMQQRLERMLRLTRHARSLTAGQAIAPIDGEAAASIVDEPAHDADSSANDEPSRDSDCSATDEVPPLDQRGAESGFAEAATQQLDPEGLVTASIQHLVDELGPVNVAVYLGTGSARFGLAAYARADLPRAAIERSLARWAEALCPRMAAEGGPQLFAAASSLAEHDAPPGHDPRADPALQREAIEELGLLERHAAVVVPCKVGGVCDAVFVVLAPASARLRDRVLPPLVELGEVFASQLARIQRVHSRHLPWWPTEID